jgi:serine/threonine-protein kinase
MKEDARRLTFANLSPTLGTPDYISPEQVKGQRGDQRSDIYALGIMFYEMLTGQVPFSGPNPFAVMNERVLNDPKPARKINPEITPELQEILYRALERDPRHRYATASEMAWDLEHPDQLGVEDEGRRQLRIKSFPGARKLMLYAGLALVPILIFALMVLMARR